VIGEVAEILAHADHPGALVRDFYAKLVARLPADTDLHLTMSESAEPSFRRPDAAERCGNGPDGVTIAPSIRETIETARGPIQSNGIQASTDPVLTPLRSEGIRALFAVPLVARGRVLGALSFASATKDEFEADEVDFFRTLALMLTSALDRLQRLDALANADLRKDEFLATLAHELRNPLAPIRNALEILRIVGGMDEAAAAKAREVLNRQVGLVVRLVDDLLDVSRIRRGQLELRIEEVELAAVVATAVEASRPHIEDRAHDLSVETPSESVMVRGDFARLAQVFSNLLNNAAKYTPHGGRISVKVERQDGVAIVSVADTGIGIPAAMLPHVFEMFTQGDRSLERSQAGLGIGLGVVERLVAMHGGRVEARSDGPSAGSEFQVALPLVSRGEPHPIGEGRRERLVPGRAGNRRRVLVADDDFDTAKSLALVLRLRGDEVRTAGHGLEAVELAAEFQPEVILLDLEMPVLSGYDACRRIRGEPWGRDVKLVALSDRSRETDRPSANEAGFDHHLVKPVEPATLVSLLDELSG
jgi:signal transduction histidine kinase